MIATAHVSCLSPYLYLYPYLFPFLFLFLSPVLVPVPFLALPTSYPLWHMPSLSYPEDFEQDAPLAHEVVSVWVWEVCV